MTFEIWLKNDDGSAVLTNQLGPLDRQTIKARDFYLHSVFDAQDYTAAQDRFLNWCQQRLPGVSEQTVDEAVMERKWRKMMYGVA